MSTVQESQLRNKQELTAIQQRAAEWNEAVMGDDGTRLLSLGTGWITGKHNPKELLDLRVNLIRSIAVG